MNSHKKSNKSKNSHSATKKKKRLFRQYSSEALQNALQNIRESKMSVRQASKQFGVPRTTLSDILKARVPERKRQMGPDPYLTVPGEEKLVLWIKNLVKCGFPPKKYFLLNTIQKIVKDSNFKTPFKHDRPGKKWLKLFLQRHPDLSIRQSEGISKGRAVITEESLRKWFKDLKSYLKENNLEDVLQDSTRIFNGDETAFSLCPNTGKVIGAKGWKNIYEVKMGNERETITVLLVFSASGQIAPPMIVYPYIRPSQELVNSIPEDWVLGRSETGWMKSEVFFEYMANDFNTWLDKNNIKKPILCFVDGHKSHMTMQLSQFCDSNDIILYALPPNCTHIMQPADVSVFKPLKTDWKDTIMKWQVKPENVNTCLTKITFAPLLAETLNNNELKNSIVNGFRRCGLFPFNTDAVDYSKCVQNILENLAASSSNEIDKANSLTQDVKHLQAVVQNIAPKLKARGVNTDIIIEEIEKSLSFEKTDSFAESPDEIGQFDTEKTESTSEINIDNAIQIDKLDGLPEIGEFDYKTRNTGEKSIDNAIPIDKLDSSYDKKVTLIFPDGSISEVPVINVLPSNESNLESVPSPTTMLDKNVNPDGTSPLNSPSNPINSSMTVTDEQRTHTQHIKNEKVDILNKAFEKHIYYPAPLKSKQQKAPKVKPPSAISSKSWRDFYNKKIVKKENIELRKRQKQEEKLRKQAENLQKSKIKKEKVEEWEKERLKKQIENSEKIKIKNKKKVEEWEESIKSKKQKLCKPKTKKN